MRDKGGPNLRILRGLVTPESWPAWGGFQEVADAMEGVGIGIVPKFAEGSTDVTYFTVMSDAGGEVMRVKADDGPMLISSPFVISLQRRPDLGGEWRVHQVGPYVLPEEMPPVT